METGLEPVGQTQGIRHYKVGQTPTSPQYGQKETLLRRRPLISPEEFPGATMRRILGVAALEHSADHSAMVKMLREYQRTGENRSWDTFRTKIPDDLLATWREILTECRRNGFVGPWAYEDKIHWRQVTSIRPGELCDLCERDCQRREDISSGESKRKKAENPNYQEPKRCWEGK